MSYVVHQMEGMRFITLWTSKFILWMCKYIGCQGTVSFPVAIAWWQCNIALLQTASQLITKSKYLLIIRDSNGQLRHIKPCGYKSTKKIFIYPNVEGIKKIGFILCNLTIQAYKIVYLFKMYKLSVWSVR